MRTRVERLLRRHTGIVGSKGPPRPIPIFSRTHNTRRRPARRPALTVNCLCGQGSSTASAGTDVMARPSIVVSLSPLSLATVSGTFPPRSPLVLERPPLTRSIDASSTCPARIPSRKSVQILVQIPGRQPGGQRPDRPACRTGPRSSRTEDRRGCSHDHRRDRAQAARAVAARREHRCVRPSRRPERATGRRPCPAAQPPVVADLLDLEGRAASPSHATRDSRVVHPGRLRHPYRDPNWSRTSRTRPPTASTRCSASPARTPATCSARRRC